MCVAASMFYDRLKLALHLQALPAQRLARAGVEPLEPFPHSHRGQHRHARQERSGENPCSV